MFFSAITKNLNLKFLTKNLFTFKIWDGVKDDKFQYVVGSMKICVRVCVGEGGGSQKTSIQGGLPKKGDLDCFHI